jgi:hypothetical protein
MGQFRRFFIRDAFLHEDEARAFGNGFLNNWQDLI